MPKADIKLAYSIISLARSKIEVGMSMPSVFAVFRLILISNFVGSRTGRSAGFSHPPKADIAVRFDNWA